MLYGIERFQKNENGIDVWSYSVLRFIGYIDVKEDVIFQVHLCMIFGLLYP